MDEFGSDLENFELNGLRMLRAEKGFESRNAVVGVEDSVYGSEENLALGGEKDAV